MKTNINNLFFLSLVFLLPPNYLYSSEKHNKKAEQNLIIYRRNQDSAFVVGSLVGALPGLLGAAMVKILGAEDVKKNLYNPIGLFPMGLLALSAAIIGQGAFEALQARVKKNKPIFRLANKGIYYENTFYSWDTLDVPILVEISFEGVWLYRDLWFPIVGKDNKFLKIASEYAEFDIHRLLSVVQNYKSIYVKQEEDIKHQNSFYYQSPENELKNIKDILVKYSGKVMAKYDISNADYQCLEITLLS